jgi:glutaredoxin-related protein
VPWDALRTLLTQAIYGGRIDNEFDQVEILGSTQKLYCLKVHTHRTRFDNAKKIASRCRIASGVSGPLDENIVLLVQSFFETVHYCDEWRKFTSVRYHRVNFPGGVYDLSSW